MFEEAKPPSQSKNEEIILFERAKPSSQSKTRKIKENSSKSLKTRVRHHFCANAGDFVLKWGVLMLK